MYKTLKSLLSFFTAVIILLSCNQISFAADGGLCGTDASWSFDETSGELSITGTGPIINYGNANYVPWRRYRDQILTINIAPGITEIGNYAFNGCEKVTQISIPDSVTTLGYSSFDKCSSLESVQIPSSVSKINNAPFYCCTALKTITVDPENTTYISDDNGILYNKDKTELIQYPAGKTDANFVIPDTVVKINFGAFAGCIYLFNVIMPESVKTIDSMSFENCSSLEVVTLSKNLEMIGEMAFSGCASLKDVYYPGSQNNWSTVSVRTSNDPLISGVFHYNETGPQSVEGKPIDTITSKSSETKTDAEKAETARSLVIPVVIGIVVLIVIFTAILVYVIFRKKPDKE